MICNTTATLSAGERRKLLVARTLYANRDISFFNEPTTNLDSDSAKSIMEAIITSDNAAVVVTHDKSMLSLFDTVFSLESGHLSRVKLQPSA